MSCLSVLFRDEDRDRRRARERARTISAAVVARLLARSRGDIPPTPAPMATATPTPTVCSLDRPGPPHAPRDSGARDARRDLGARPEFGRARGEGCLPCLLQPQRVESLFLVVNRPPPQRDASSRPPGGGPSRGLTRDQRCPGGMVAAAAGGTQAGAPDQAPFSERSNAPPPLRARTVTRALGSRNATAHCSAKNLHGEPGAVSSRSRRRSAKTEVFVAFVFARRLLGRRGGMRASRAREGGKGGRSRNGITGHFEALGSVAHC